MRKCIRVVLLALLGLLSATVLGAAAALVAAVSLAATALIVPGTGTPNANSVGEYMPNFRDYYMQKTQCDDASCELEGVNYPASFWPIPLPGWCDPGRCEKFNVSVAAGVENLKQALGNLENIDPDFDGDLVIAGYSQGARVVSIAKTRIANGDWDQFLDGVDSVQFVFIGNPNRPNGGILSRFGILGRIPILDVTTGQPTPTDTEFETEDWAIRWEGIADFPQYLLNPLAVINSLMGFYYDHGTYLAKNQESDADETPAGYTVDEWREITSNPTKYPEIVHIQKLEGSDTTYYTVTPKVLPLVRPLHSIPFIGKPIADLLEPALRVIIEETGYDRNIPFGQYSPIGLIPFFNPITLVLKLIPAIFQGINNFLANFGLATEIPLTPEVPTPAVSPLAGQDEDEPENARLVSSERDDLAGAGLKSDQANGDLDQQAGGEANQFVAHTQTDGDLVLTEGIETSQLEDEIVAGAAEGEELPETVPEPPTADVDPGVNGADPGQGTGVVMGKEPEDNQVVAANRVDADGRSVSLDASPNRPAADPADGDNGSVQRIAPVTKPSENLSTTPAPAGTVEGSEDDTKDSENSQDSQPAAA
ncbi:hypothetical protein AU197_12035 [Mycobacterium sp. IS-1590]|uniref:PE-PPE domain-containing protein n=1 Tax=Mycobacterium sp. IS-1590 TaxID=1772286 RepID=UPI0007461BCF|nr:PE-PPE domain-containing protein [Mycobacterium sp. IS-1590]KUI44985.1 hypothetical protein AU197_12035 [Mycobacterium sp. IS-1590]